MKSEADSSSLGRKPFARASGMLATVLQMLLEKRFFIECLCCDCTLHARPLEQKGRGNKHTSLIACLATVFVSRCWGYSLGLFVFQSSSDGSEQAGTGNADALLARVLVWTLQSVAAFNSCCFVPLGSGVPDGLDGAINAVPT